MESDKGSSILSNLTFPRATFTSAYKDDRHQLLPQCIAHRGDATTLPENTLAAFEAAVQVGAHAIEMDIQTTKDGVVVISHDPTLQSQFGRPQKIIDCDWSELQDLKTLAQPHEHIPRLTEVLDWLLQPGKEEIWVMLDFKPDGNMAQNMRLVYATLCARLPLTGMKSWHERMTICVAPASSLVLAAEYLPGYPVTHTGFSASYVRQLFAAPNISFDLASSLIILPGWRSLLEDTQHRHDRQVFAWTVNEEETMRWCIRRKLDGVLTDNPRKFLDVCTRFDGTAREPWFGLSLAAYWQALKDWWLWRSLARQRRKMLEIPTN